MIHPRGFGVPALLLLVLAFPARATVYVNRDYYWTGTEWQYGIVDRHYASPTTTTWGADTDFGQNGSGTPYVLEADVYIDSGATLNVEAGVTVKIPSSRGIYLAGTLSAQGTAESHVTFTAASGAAPGSWDEICLYGSGASGSVFRYCDIRYGGSHGYRSKGGFTHYADGNILAKDCSPTIDHVTSSYSGLAGFYMLGQGNPVIVDSTFRDNQYGLAFSHGSYQAAQSAPLPVRGNTITANAYAVWASAQCAGAFDPSNSITGNTHNVVQMDGGEVETSTTWRWLLGDPVWEVYGDITCPAGKSLTIEPGCVVKFGATRSLSVAGTLTAVGTASDKIRFTSIKDDSVGGDSNGDGSATAPAKGDWSEVLFLSGSDGSRLDNCILRYGGSGRSAISQGVIHNQNGNLSFHNSAPEVSNCVSSDSKHDGAYLMGSSHPVLDSVSFADCTDWAVESIDPASNAVVTNCTATGCGRNAIRIPAGNMSGARTWYKSLPYVITGDASLDPAGSLTIEPAGVVKLAGGAGLYLNGAVQATGTAAEPIRFTSLQDDSAGGDTNGDGSATSPATGDWREVFLGGSSSSSAFAHCVFRYGGSGDETSSGGITHNADGNVYCHSVGPSFSYCEFSFSGGDGAYLNDSAASFASSTLARNTRHGLQVSGNSDALAASCLFSANGQFGVYEHTADGASLSATYCNVHGLMRYQSNDPGTGWQWHTGVPSGTGNLAGAPVFMNAAAGDFGIKLPSPCIDAGDPSKTDPNGTRLDIGAHCYSGPWNPVSILTARDAADETEVLLTGKTAIAGASELGDRIYIEDDTRTAGLAIMSNTASHAGDRIYVTGKLATIEGERAIIDSIVSAVIPASTVPTPLFMQNAALGGAGANANCPGMPDATGAYNLGLLVKASGKVTAIGAGCFWITDGSSLANDPEKKGVKVLSDAPVSEGQSVAVVGISGAYAEGSDIRRVVRARSASDVTVTQ